jgi:hypothetical protein
LFDYFQSRLVFYPFDFKPDEKTLQSIVETLHDELSSLGAVRKTQSSPNFDDPRGGVRMQSADDSDMKHGSAEMNILRRAQRFTNPMAQVDPAIIQILTKDLGVGLTAQEQVGMGWGDDG